METKIIELTEDTMCAIPIIGDMNEEEVFPDMRANNCESIFDYVAVKSVAFADALIHELKRPKDYAEMFHT